MQFHPMKKRTLDGITHDLRAIAPSDRQQVCSLAYRLRDLDFPEKLDAKGPERAMRRLLRDIISGQANDVRMSYLHAP